jgi:hypothetical protein
MKTSLNLIKQGTLVQVTNFQKGKEKEKEEEKVFFEKSAKRIISIYSGSKAKKNWNKAKADENKSDFPKSYYYGKDSFESLKLILKGITPLLD